jgi:predicted choloylglycine hydrolase
MSRFHRVLFLWALGCMAGCMASSPQMPVTARPATSSPSSIAASAPAPFPIPVVQLFGSSQQLGEQQGQKEDLSIHQLHDNYLIKFVGSGYRRIAALYAASLFETQLRPEHRDELRALATATNIAEQETMLGQCFLDLAQLSGCSTVALPASASPDHIGRFGRNLDFWSLDVADKYTTVFIVHPNDGRYAYASIGWPGMIGVLSGINEHGLCLANMEVPRPMRPPTAMPYTLLYRTVLERCRTVQEAVDLLKKTPRQTANNLMLMDAAGFRAVAEITPESVNVRWGQPDSALISTNHQRNQDTQTPGLCDRYDYLRAASAISFGQIDPNRIEQLLAHVGRRGTLQSMIFEPQTRVLYLSAGTTAASKPFARIDLRPLFACGVASTKP